MEVHARRFGTFKIMVTNKLTCRNKGMTVRNCNVDIFIL
jgi:hypothetical protein